MNDLKTINFFDFSHSLAGESLKKFEYPWQAVPEIKNIISDIIKHLDRSLYSEVSPNVFVHKTAKVAPTAYLGEFCVIGEGTEVRHCAFVRGNALVGNNCVVGNSVELKNVILFDNVQVPHFNYVGDSILGYKSHMGAGSITSNVKSDKTLVTISHGKDKIETNLKKLGAILGDQVEVGCNSVLNPGTIIGKNTNVYPLCSLRGFYEGNSIVKDKNNVIKKH